MKFDNLDRLPHREAEWTEFFAHQRRAILGREAENADGRPKLALDWIKTRFRPESKDNISTVAQKISNRIGVDAETTFYILLCSTDVALRWHPDSDGNRFRILDIAFDVGKLLGIGCNTVYTVLRAADEM